MKSAEYSYARKFIFDALHLDRNLPTPDTLQQMQVEDWDYLSNIAKMHRLGPMLHHKLSRFADMVPLGVRDQLKASQRKHAMRNLKIYRELVTVTRILEAANIPSIALKGAYLARFSYPDPGLRPMRDLDLLIRPEQVIAAFELLKRHGYQSVHEAGLPEAHFLLNEHLSPLASPEGIAIELHHRLISDAHSAFSAGLEDALWARNILNEVGGNQIRFLCAEDLLLHLCIHATYRHQFNLGPLALTDIAFLVETNQIDWPVFLNACGNWQRGALSLLYLAKLRLGAKIPEEVIAPLCGNNVDAAWQKSAEYLLFSDLSEHKMLTTNVKNFMYSVCWSEKVSALFEIVFPPRSVISLHFPVSADSPMVYLYYPRNWYRLFRDRLPMLLQVFRGGKGALRVLTMHRDTLDAWLHDNAGKTK